MARDTKGGFMERDGMARDTKGGLMHNCKDEKMVDKKRGRL